MAPACFSSGIKANADQVGINQVNGFGKPAVFFDRDGVLNHAFVRDGKPYAPRDLSEFEIVGNGRQDLLRLKGMGFVLLVVTNQPDIARGTQTRGRVDEMHEKLRRELPIDDVFVCPHDNNDGCSCRKPAAGLLFEAAEHYGLDLRESYMVGDQWRDIDAGHAAGCTTILIDYGYKERGPTKEPDLRSRTLHEAAVFILKSRSVHSVAIDPILRFEGEEL
jgi:D-glycero-D-manno-heptose 1,7-bisphosphate phosphatase